MGGGEGGVGGVGGVVVGGGGCLAPAQSETRQLSRVSPSPGSINVLIKH